MSNPEDPAFFAPRRWQTEEVAVQKLAARASRIAASTNSHPLLGSFTAYPELPPLRTTGWSAESSRLAARIGTQCPPAPARPRGSQRCGVLTLPSKRELLTSGARIAPLVSPGSMRSEGAPGGT